MNKPVTFFMTGPEGRRLAVKIPVGMREQTMVITVPGGFVIERDDAILLEARQTLDECAHYEATGAMEVMRDKIDNYLNDKL